MQMKMKNQYDVTKNMLRTIRTLTESVSHKKSINEEETENSGLNMHNMDGNVKDDITVINDVDVKLLSNDERDMELKDDQKELISKLIDSFKQQVSQMVDFEPGITINQNQIRLDGKLTDEKIDFVFIAGEEAGIYINADMLKLEQNMANVLTKLAKFEETYKTELEPIITQRNHN
jgi:flagellar motility protein MotE (MotC chaperone)